jgi:two-component system, chemotaxis family, sensor kinase CheA
MDDLLRDFLTESSENLATLDIELVRLEQNPNDPQLLSSIFRLVHTVKGTCGFLGLPRLEHVAHAGENILGKFRDGELPVTPEAVGLILKSIDTIKSLLAHLEQNGAEPEGNDEGLIAELNAMAQGQGGEQHAKANGATPPPVQAAPPPSPPKVEAPPVPDGPDEFGFTPVPAHLTGQAAAPAAAVAPAAPASVPAAKPAEAEGAAKGGGASVADQSIRVGVDVLENLMTIVSELVLTRNQLLQILRGQKDSSFASPLQRLNQVTSELQEGVMKTRMQPIGNAWAKLPRIIRDLSHELGKKIDLQMVGAETELDRQVLELIKDPLTHMVRNSADHGIEVPADRIKAGKPEVGVVLLNAYHEGGHIILEISDDGKGLALDKIKAKAVQNGLATEAELATMPEQQIMQFIFKPGFSTAAKVTSVSGRGVGMDVVKTNIEKIGGTVDFQSVAGKGSRFFIKIPLTLAIVSALIVQCCKERFAIPQICVVELVQATAQSEHRVEYINGAPVLRLRNRLLPLVSLRKSLQLGEDEVKADGCYFVIVIQTGNSTFGVIVDHVFDTEEIVVKPVSPLLRDIKVFSGNTILGDGNVIMILDPNGLVQHAGEIKADMATTHHAVQAGHRDDKQSFLLFHAGNGAPKAVPLSLIARLESIDRKLIECSGDSKVVQYRGALMPLLPLADLVSTDGDQPVLVFNDEDKNMGLMVDKIIDIVEERLHIDLSSGRPGYLGTSIIAGKATDVVDAAYFISQAFKDWFGSAKDTGYGAEQSRRVLLVDDSPFFRNLLTPLLTVAGYEVTSVENPTEAFRLHEAGRDFDAIVSDIEMPGMNGFEFAAKLRMSGRWSKLPILAMSSHAAPRDLDRGRQAGFTDYIPKFNREALLDSLQQSLGREEARA